MSLMSSLSRAGFALGRRPILVVLQAERRHSPRGLAFQTMLLERLSNFNSSVKTRLDTDARRGEAQQSVNSDTSLTLYVILSPDK